MKILVISNLYPPNVVGGYEQLCFDVTSELARRGHEIVVLTSNYVGTVVDYPRQRIHRDLRLLVGNTIYTPYAGGDMEKAQINTANIMAARERLVAERPDVLFIWNLFFLDGSFFRELMEVQVRKVLMLTDNWLMVMKNPEFMTDFFQAHVFGDAPFVPPLLGNISATPARSFLGRILGGLRLPPTTIPQVPSAAIFGSHFMAALYHAGQLHFREERVIHNGVRLTKRPPHAFRDRSTLIGPGELRLLFAGRVTEIKGVHKIIEALDLLDMARLDLTKVFLTVLGDTRDTAYLMRLRNIAERLPPNIRVEFQDAVAEEDLFALFQEHDIYIFSSIYEPFSLTLIHAMAAGIPTIASRVGGNMEIVRDRETGVLYAKGDAAELAQAIACLVLDAALRSSVAAGARDVAASFTFQRMTDAMEAFLQETGVERRS